MTPYLSFDGNCEEAINFYASVHGGKIEGINRYAGSPMESDVPADFKNKIMHASLTSPLGEVFWGGKFGMVTDRYGFHWMLSVQ